MMHPERIVMAEYGGCTVIAMVLFAIGFLLDTPILKSIAWWFIIAAASIPFFALLVCFVGMTIEKRRRK